MANKAKRRSRPARDMYGISSAQAREASRREAVWREQHRLQMRTEAWKHFGRGALRAVLWSFFIAAAMAGAAARWGL